MRLLESAIVRRRPNCGIRRSRSWRDLRLAHEHARLRELMLRIDRSTPQMIKGALLLARNHQLASTASCRRIEREVVGPALRAHICRRYQLTDYPHGRLTGTAQMGRARRAGRVAVHRGGSDRGRRDRARVCGSVGGRPAR